jgi:hypothetical protein
VSWPDETIRFFRVTEPIRRGENKCGKRGVVVVGVTGTPKCEKRR